MFENKNILITGGTGSFGKSLVKILLTNFKIKIGNLLEMRQNK